MSKNTKKMEQNLKLIKPSTEICGRTPMTYKKYYYFKYFNPIPLFLYGLISTIFLKYGWAAWLYVIPRLLYCYNMRNKIIQWEKEDFEDAKRRGLF